MANNHMKIGSTSLVIRKGQTETTMKYHYTPTSMTKMEKTKCLQGYGGTIALTPLVDI